MIVDEFSGIVTFLNLNHLQSTTQGHSPMAIVITSSGNRYYRASITILMTMRLITILLRTHFERQVMLQVSWLPERLVQLRSGHPTAIVKVLFEQFSIISKN